MSALCQGLCPPPDDLSSNSFVSQFICLPGPVSGAVSASGGFVSQFICLPGSVSGAVSASGGFVFQFICLPIHLSPRSCVRGCVRLRTICLPIHLSPRSLSPNSFVSQVLWQGLCPPPGDWFPNSFVSQFICLPGPVSGAVSAFGGFVSQFVCPPSFPKQLTVGVLNSILRCVRLVSGAVSASLGSVSPIICFPSFVSHVLCQGLCPPPWALCLPSVPKQFTVGVLNSLSSGVRLCSDGGVWFSGCPEFICPLVAIHLSPNLAGGVQLSGCLQFICLPLSQLICFPVWLVVSRSLAVSNSFVCPYINSFVSQSGWCPALRLSPIHLSPLVATHLSPNLAGGVRLWLSPIHLSCLVATHLSPSLAGGVRLFGCLSHAGDVRLFGCL